MSEMVQDRNVYSYCGRLTGTRELVCALSNGAIFSDLE